MTVLGSTPDYDSGYTPAQRVMRQDMEARAEQIRRGMSTAGQAVDDILGLAGTDPVVTELALEVIRESPNLTLSLAQWQVVQAMVEGAVRTGIARGRAEAGAPAD